MPRIRQDGPGSLAETVLITGGAGFIGRYVARALVARGDRVRVLDSLIEQVHAARGKPADLDAAVEFVEGVVRDGDRVRGASASRGRVTPTADEVEVGEST